MRESYKSKLNRFKKERTKRRAITVLMLFVLSGISYLVYDRISFRYSKVEESPSSSPAQDATLSR
jgi:hypothetical protein